MARAPARVTPMTAVVDVTGPATPANGRHGITWPSESVEVTLRRMAAVMTAAWMCLEGARLLATSDTGVVAGAVQGALLVTTILACLAMAVRRSTRAELVVVATAVVAVVDYLLADPALPEGGFAVYWLPNVVTMNAAFLLRPPRSRRIVGPFAAFAAVVVLLRTGPYAGWSTALASALSCLCFALGDGIAAMLAARALRSVAATTDEAMTQAEQIRERNLVELDERRAAARLVARLHDTVINTLAAVGTRGDRLDPAGVRRHCAEAAAIAEGVVRDDDRASAAGDLRRALDFGRAGTSESTRVRYVGTSADELVLAVLRLPLPVGEAMAGGIGEALRNVAKHSGGADATVTLDAGPAFCVTVADDGVGFDGRLVEGRGLAHVVAEICRPAGVAVEVVGSPGGGTSVTFTHRPPGPTDEQRLAAEDSARLLASVAGPFALRFATCLAVMCSCVTVLTFGRWPSAGSLAAVPVLWLALALGAATLGHLPGGGRLPGTGLLRRLESLPVVGELMVVALVPAIVTLPAVQVAGCDRAGTAWWGADGGLAVILFAIFGTRRWLPVTAGLVVYWASVGYVAWTVPPACAGYPIGSGLLDFVGMIAGWFFGSHLAVLARRASFEQSVLRQERVRQSRQHEALRVRHSELCVALERTARLLTGIADGTWDPREPSVRRRCLDEESLLRQLSQLDAHLQLLGPQLAAALSLAHARGVRLVLRLREVDAPTAAAATAVGAVLKQVVTAAAPLATVTVAMFGTASAPVLTVTGDGSAATEPRSQPDDAVAAAGWVVERTDLDDQYLIELSWKGTEWTTAQTTTVDRRPTPAAAGPASPSSTTTDSSVTV